jgi:hypothetical protein
MIHAYTHEALLATQACRNYPAVPILLLLQVVLLLLRRRHTDAKCILASKQQQHAFTQSAGSISRVKHKQCLQLLAVPRLKQKSLLLLLQVSQYNTQLWAALMFTSHFKQSCCCCCCCK